MDCVYLFGIDPAWFLSPQLLSYTNSIKMRIAVIIGVWHMSMAIIVKGFNSIFNKQYLVLFFEVIGGLIILLGLFGFMDALIVLKWGYPMNAYSTDDEPCKDEKMDCGPVFTLRNCPSIISVMINNFLKMGTQDVYFFEDQKTVTNILTILVVVSIPLMLFVKPCALAYCCRSKE
jgi:V-type H+-transporting ATPase subunit a